jgi:hypothetical protein
LTISPSPSTSAASPQVASQSGQVKYRVLTLASVIATMILVADA